MANLKCHFKLATRKDSSMKESFTFFCRIFECERIFLSVSNRERGENFTDFFALFFGERRASFYF